MPGRRRRKGNPLLMRIILISIGIHVVVVPILAYFGAFHRIEMSLRHDVVITIPPPEKTKLPEVKKAPKKAPHTVNANRGHKAAAQHGTPLKQHVVAVSAPASAGGGSNGPTIINPEKGATPGTFPPSGPGKSTQPVNTGNNGAKSVTTTPPNPPLPVVKTPTPVAVAPTPPKTHVPVVVDAVATYSPQPTIPDDLRNNDMDTQVTATIMVNADGSPEDVKITKSSGSDELDQLALDTAKKWKFKPATSDGVPIESRVNLHIEFEVN